MDSTSVTLGKSGNNSKPVGIESMDFSSIEELDPSVADGHKIIYDRECPFELRIQNNADSAQEVGTLEAIKVKILVLVSTSGHLASVFRLWSLM